MKNRHEPLLNEGFLLINKPRHWTSFDVVAKLRGITGIRKIGHCGTLDPLARGLLICAVGRSATKQIGCLIKKDKVYIARIKLGEESNTYDLEGEIKKTLISRKPKLSEIKNTLQGFIGDIEQAPPIFSAKKIKGRKAYELARKGEVLTMKKEKIKINNIKLLDYNFPFLKIEIDCGSGTYIRSLANDIGRKLKTGALIYSLKRISIDRIKVRNALDINKIGKENWKKFLIGKIVL